jgi:hypothetical protein
MGQEVYLARSGAIELVESPPGVQIVAVQGYLSFAAVATMLRQFEQATVGGEVVRVVVFDLLGIEGFQPGVPAKIIQWLGGQADRIRAGVLVTASPVLLATARAAELLLPTTMLATASSRREAIDMAHRLVAGRERASTAVRRRDREQVPDERKHNA